MGDLNVPCVYDSTAESWTSCAKQKLGQLSGRWPFPLALYLSPTNLTVSILIPADLYSSRPDTFASRLGPKQNEISISDRNNKDASLDTGRGGGETFAASLWLGWPQREWSFLSLMEWQVMHNRDMNTSRNNTNGLAKHTMVSCNASTRVALFARQTNAKSARTTWTFC